MVCVSIVCGAGLDVPAGRTGTGLELSAGGAASGLELPVENAGAGLEFPAGKAAAGLELPAGEPAAAVTGQIVVDSTIVSVVKWPLSGQSVTVKGQDRTV